MTESGSERDKETLRRVRTLKAVLLGVQFWIVVGVAAFLLLRGGFSTQPLYIPFHRVLVLLVLTVVALAVQLIVFRGLEIKHAPTKGQRYVLVNLSWRGAQRALAFALLFAIFFAAPPAQALVVNVLSTYEARTLDAGESYPVAFASQDAFGITRAQELRVTVLTGALRVRLADARGGAAGGLLGAGEQVTYPLESDVYLPYAVTFENALDGVTSFTYRVHVVLPAGFPALVAAAAASLAVANGAWLLYLRPLKEQVPTPSPTRRRVARSPHRPARSYPRAWHDARALWKPAYTPFAFSPGRAYPYRRNPNALRERTMPPPPVHLERDEGEPVPSPPEATADGPLVEELEEAAEAPVGEETEVRVSALVDRAAVHVRGGEYKDALKTYDTILGVDERNLEALLGKADLLRRLQRHPEALPLLDRILHWDPWNHKALLHKGALLEELDRPEEALGCYEAVLHGGPHVLEALVRKGDLLLGRGEFEAAADAYKEALRLKPGDRELEEKMRSLDELRTDPLDIARREQEAGRVDRAEEFYRRALGGERSGDARRELIDLLFQNEREEECIPLLDDAIAGSPEDHQLLLKRARAHAKDGRLEAALQDCERACTLEPDMASLWAIRGALEADLGREEEARTSLEKAASMDPDDDESRRRLKELGRRTEEHEDLETLLRSIQEIPEGALVSLLKAFRTVPELKRAKVKDLASLEDVPEELAKYILKTIRKGR